MLQNHCTNQQTYYKDLAVKATTTKPIGLDNAPNNVKSFPNKNVTGPADAAIAAIPIAKVFISGLKLENACIKEFTFVMILVNKGNNNSPKFAPKSFL